MPPEAAFRRKAHFATHMKPRLVLAGGSGFIGNLLAEHFRNLNWEPVILTRSPAAGRQSPEVFWDAETLGEWVQTLEGSQAVINLAGRSVNCRFTPENKRQVMASRVNSTRILGEAIAGCSQPPAVWLNSSTATIYKHTFNRAHDETSTDFRPTVEAKDAYSVQVALAWEKAFTDAPTPRTRKVALRTTLVMGTVPGGVFQILRRLARLGLGGKMGSGRQFVSWIHDVDFCRAVEWILNHPELHNPVNMAAPNPLSNADMMKAFRRLCGIPFGLPAAEWMLEVGAFFMRTETELLLKSRRVVPGKLLSGGFQFEFPNLDDALRDLNTRTHL